MNYESRITKKVVAMKGKAIYDESATMIEIDDEAAGEYIAISQADATVKIDGDEWPAIRAAIDEMVADLRDEDGKKQAKQSIFRDDAEIDAKILAYNEWVSDSPNDYWKNDITQAAWLRGCSVAELEHFFGIGYGDAFESWWREAGKHYSTRKHAAEDAFNSAVTWRRSQLKKVAK